MLIFAAVAALALTKDWELGHFELIPYATPGLITFGVFALPAGWLADRWSREGVMGMFFVGIELATIGTSLCQESDSDGSWPLYHWNVCRYLSSRGLSDDRSWGSANGA